jgi:phosphoserine phosphatase RsbX
MNVAVGMACTVADGEEVAGDEAVVARHGPLVLIGLADGLGHGPHAAAAAGVFCNYVRGHVADPIEDLLTSAGHALSTTRGAAAALLRIHETTGELEFTGVGNVAFKSIAQCGMSMFCCAGILGRRVRTIRSFRYSVVPGDLLVMHTDGVAAGFDLASYRDADPNVIARRIVEAHRKSFDDSTCVVAMVRDGAAP